MLPWPRGRAIPPRLVSRHLFPFLNLSEGDAHTTMVSFGPSCVAHSSSGGKSVRSEENTSELQSLMRISYAVFCLKKTQTGYSLKRKKHILNYHNSKPFTI